MAIINYPYINPTPGKIPIIASTLVPSNVISPMNTIFSPTLWDVDTCADCGFNILGTPYEVDFISKISELSSETNRKCNININKVIGAALEDRINKYKNIPSTACWDLGDEPRDRETIRLWGLMAEQVYGLDKNHMCLVNLMPVKRDDMKDWNTYDEYLNYVQKYLKPAVWMFDYYPIRVKQLGDKHGDFDWHLRKKYYELLKKISDLSKSTSRPFWTCCRSVGIIYNGENEGHNPAPTLGQLRFVTFSALAFGAQGLLFWTYAERENSDDETYFDAPVYKRRGSDPMGLQIGVRAKSATWNLVKSVISDVRTYNAIFYNCELQDVRCYLGKGVINSAPDTLPEGMERLVLPFGPLLKFESDSPYGFLVSLIKNGASNYLIIVNRDIDNTQEITLEFNPNIIITEVELSPVTPPDLNSYNTAIKRTIAAGGIKIFHWYI